MNSPFLLDQARALANRVDLPVALPEPRRAGSPGSTSTCSAARPSPARSRPAAGSSRPCPRPTMPDAPGPWEAYAQVLLMTNEFMFLD